MKVLREEPLAVKKIDPPERQFKGIWTPAEIWLHPDLSIHQKMLWSEVNSFSSQEEGCWASNVYLAGFLGVTEGSLKNMLTKLRKMELIETVGFDGRNRFLVAKLPKGHPRMTQGSSCDDLIGNPRMTSQPSEIIHNRIDHQGVTEVKNALITKNRTKSIYINRKNVNKPKASDELFDPMFNAADPNHLPQQLRTPEVIEIWGKYCNRRETLLKNPVTAFALKKILNQLSTATAEEASDALFRAWDGKWTGIFPKKNGQQSFKKPQKVEPFAEGKVF